MALGGSTCHIQKFQVGKRKIGSSQIVPNEMGDCGKINDYLHWLSQTSLCGSLLTFGISKISLRTNKKSVWDNLI